VAADVLLEIDGRTGVARYHWRSAQHQEGWTVKRSKFSSSATLLVEVLVAVGIFAGVILTANSRLPWWIPPVRWWAFAFMTGVAFWYPVRPLKSNWPRRSFWVTVGCLLLVHVVAWSAILASSAEWRMIWFVPPMVIEVPLLVWVLDRLGFHG